MAQDRRLESQNEAFAERPILIRSHAEPICITDTKVNHHQSVL